VRRVIHGLAIHSTWDSKATRTTFRQLVLDLMHSPAYARLSQVKKSFKLLEELAFAGFVFPADLMLFRKSIFTLEGVLNDLCPSFDMDFAIMKYLSALITEEIPSRIGNLFFPLADKAENYSSLISNVELQSLLFHQYVDAVGSCYRSIADNVSKSYNLSGVSPI
jgi:ubiquinone biosynthesis protein